MGVAAAPTPIWRAAAQTQVQHVLFGADPAGFFVCKGSRGEFPRGSTLAAAVLAQTNQPLRSPFPSSDSTSKEGSTLRARLAAILLFLPRFAIETMCLSCS